MPSDPADQSLLDEKLTNIETSLAQGSPDKEPYYARASVSLSDDQIGDETSIQIPAGKTFVVEVFSGRIGVQPGQLHLASFSDFGNKRFEIVQEFLGTDGSDIVGSQDLYGFYETTHLEFPSASGLQVSLSRGNGDRESIASMSIVFSGYLIDTPEEQ